jgi:hypothetical protein
MKDHDEVHRWPRASKIKGSITEKYETFQANPVLTKESFENASDATGKTGN